MGRRSPRLLPALLLVAAVAPLLPFQAQAPDDPAPDPEVRGGPAAFGAEAAAEARVAVPEGAPLRESPDARSAALAIVDAATELPVLERRGAWVRVRYGSILGWVNPTASAPRGLADLPADLAEPSPYGASPGLAPEVLAAVEARFGPPSDAVRLGGRALYTDLDDPALLGFLEGVAAGLPELYRGRFGLDPGTGHGEAVVVFAGEEGYRAFAAEHAGLLGVGEGGHAGRGVAVLYAGGRDRSELASLLAHELTHLLNARTLGSRTPPWLEEGLANDLAFSELGARGRLDPAGVGGRERRETSVDGAGRLVVRTTWEGGRGAVVSLVRSLSSGELPAVETLVHLPWRELVDPARRDLLYAQGAFFVRYLLDREPAAFRRYLRYLAAGGGDDPAVLAEALGRGWDEVDREFRRWLLARAAALGLAGGT